MDARRIALVDDLDWPLRRHYDVLEAVQEYAAERGWQVDPGPYPELRLAAGIPCDGVIGRLERANYDGLLAAGIPMINTWMHSPVCDLVPTVGADFFAAGKLSAQHLAARGVARFVYAGIGARKHADSHYQGICAVAEEYGFSCEFQPVDGLHDATNRARWEKTSRELTAYYRQAETPIGVVAMSDVVARSLVLIIQDAGLRIPNDVAIVSTGDDQLASSNLEPTLSSVDMGYHQVGYEAASLLERAMAGEALAAAMTLVPPKGLVVRHSSDAYAVRDPRVAAALAFMRDNCSALIGVPEVVKQVELSRNLLEKRFREYTGRTINQELIRLRVELLKRLLVESDKPVNALHADAGFGTASNMYQTFRRVVGVTPAEYRAARHNQRQG